MKKLEMLKEFNITREDFEKSLKYPEQNEYGTIDISVCNKYETPYTVELNSNMTEILNILER